MKIPRLLKQSIAGLRKVTGGLFGTGGAAGVQEGFICAACHSTYDRQHYQCPQCGEMVVVPLDADEAEGRGPFD